MAQNAGAMISVSDGVPDARDHFIENSSAAHFNLISQPGAEAPGYRQEVLGATENVLGSMFF